MKQTKAAFMLILILAVGLKATDGGCTEYYSTNLKMSIDIYGQTVYFQDPGDTSGFWSTTMTNVDFTQLVYYFYALYYNDDLYFVDGSTPSTYGFTTTNTIQVEPSYMSALTSGASAYGGAVQTVGIYSWMPYLGGYCCAGFSYPDGSNQIAYCNYNQNLYAGATTYCNTYNCYPCDCSCSSCFGPGPGTCTACNSGYYYVPTITRCVATCPKGFFPNSTTMQCNPCPGGTFYISSSNSCGNCYSGCLHCNGTSSNQCTVCQPGYYLLSTTCQSTCPVGYWPNNATATCTPCAFQCYSCFGSSNSNCTECNMPYLLNPDGRTCLATCPAGSYKNYLNVTCTNCSTGCATCFGPSTKLCSNCTTGYYLNPDMVTCTTTCPHGFWPDASNNICSQCSTGCAICTTGANNTCTACSIGRFLVASLSQCVPACPTGYYGDITTSNCTTCNVACQQCTGPSAQQCLSCASGYYLLPQSTTCSSCPDGYWPNIATNICSYCSPQCATCNGPTVSECLSCNAGYFYNALENICGTSCPEGYFQDSTNNLCSVCDPSCVTCDGSSNSNCGSCTTGYYLQSDSKTCLSTCPTIGYWASSSSNTCLKCASGCNSCSGPTNDECLSCTTGFFFNSLSTTCAVSCPQGYYKDSINNLCSACDPACNSCRGPSNYNCTACTDGYFLVPQMQVCLISCPATGYWDSDGVCFACASECMTCTGFTNTDCITCNSSYYLQPLSSTCIQTCPDDYYMNTDDNTCVSCSPCVGDAQTFCSKCINNATADVIAYQNSGLPSEGTKAAILAGAALLSLALVVLFVLYVRRVSMVRELLKDRIIFKEVRETV